MIKNILAPIAAVAVESKTYKKIEARKLAKLNAELDEMDALARKYNGVRLAQLEQSLASGIDTQYAVAQYTFGNTSASFLKIVGAI